LHILDESVELDEEPSEFETVVLSNITSILRAKNKFKALSRSIKQAKAFVVGNSDIKDNESSSSDEDADIGKNVNVFFFDSE
jgi:hypothetical protein